MAPVASRQMPTRPYQQWQLSDATSAIVTPAWLPMNRQFYEGDHWQGGSGWVGPRPAPGEMGGLQAMEEISRAFTSQNIIAEIIERRAAGIIGREPTWTLVPRTLVPTTDDGSEGTVSREDQALINEAVDLLTPWWDERGMHEQLQQWVHTMLWAERASLRGFVPPGMLVPGQLADGTSVQVLRVNNPADALNAWYVHQPTPESASVYENPETRERAALYLYKRGDEQRAELTYLDRATQLTVQRQLGAGLATYPAQLRLGGRLTMYEATHPRFITQQVRQMQRAFNLSLSMLPRNIVTGGFLEMVVLNGMLPGHYEDDPTQASGRKFVQHEFYRGAGVTNWIAGIDNGQDQDGNRTMTTPSVQWRPPIAVDPAIAANGELYERILDAAQQAHVLMNGDANASGRSRDSARGEYRNSLRAPRVRTQRAGRWLIETALAWVETATGRPGYFTSRLRCDFQCMLDTGAPSPEERAANTLEFQAGLLSDETSMERNGVEDIDAERARIQGSSRSLLALGKERATVVQLWLDSGLSFVAACVASGMDEKAARKLEALSTKDDVDPNVAPVPPAPIGGGNDVPPPAAAGGA